MIAAPEFWQSGGWPAALLAPLSTVVAGATARRVARAGWQAPVPVLCCGNATVGGAGKTTLALDLGARCAAGGARVAYLTRGYGGRVRGVLRVDPARHAAALVGDEPRLLAAVAPTYVAADRAAGARAAVADGATLLIMDDGLQNPTLAKTAALLVIDGAAGFGNGRVLPAGPLREPVGAAAARCAAAVLIGADARGAAALLPVALPVLRARLVPDEAARALAGVRVLAFAGLARPGKFFAMLEECGAVLAACRPYPDHAPHPPARLRALRAEAARLGAVLVTTPKDAARLSSDALAGIRVAGVGLAWEDAAARDALLAGLLP